MVEVGGRPIFWHIMKIYAHYGFRDFVLCLGYRGNMIKEYFLNYEAMNNDFTICLGPRAQIHYHDAHDEQDFRVTLADTGLEAMTGGPHPADPKVRRRRHFLLTYGDGVSDVDIRGLLAFHKSHGKMATVTTVPPISRFGILDIDATTRSRTSSKSPAPMAGSAPATSSSTAKYSTTWAATIASSNASRWNAWPRKDN